MLHDSGTVYPKGGKYGHLEVHIAVPQHGDHAPRAAVEIVPDLGGAVVAAGQGDATLRLQGVEYGEAAGLPQRLGHEAGLGVVALQALLDPKASSGEKDDVVREARSARHYVRARRRRGGEGFGGAHEGGGGGDGILLLVVVVVPPRPIREKERREGIVRQK